ncbi:hypothetical protein GMLC_13770 [Geomonas limicola]|uniref:ATP-binding protein n=2 Tax=Geomonas limicola TaxID=2740186 RepID=A0A6V8N5E4_9BACT|nr:hypothetical protein GMLC_13770 [Geomonas limicola]
MRIVVTLRDTGIEPLRNWLGNVLASVSIETVEVGPLNDEESEILAKEQPHLRRLLFAAKQVQEIVRRPFFAKILNQNFGSHAGDEGFLPQSEVDLLENWWNRGGYDSTGQSALERQRSIIELSSKRARHFERELTIRELSTPTVAVIDQLIRDGILQYVRGGHSLRFSHDIFFEWAYFHALSDAEDWLSEVRACGEPPAIARSVELLSQWQFNQGPIWTETLGKFDQALMRSQWTRSWLLAPLAAPSFRTGEIFYWPALEANDHYYLKKLLVWFQAERTMPNPVILKGDLPQDERIRVADFLGWPSDFESWSRFIFFLLTRISAIPITLYPAVLSIFEVWQNALAGSKNPISSALLDQVSAWLAEVSEQSASRRPSPIPSRWAPLGPQLGDFTSSLLRLILRSAEVRPDLTEAYLNRLINMIDLRRERFAEVVTFSPILARSHPMLLVELTLKHMLRELPEEQKARELKEYEQAIEQRNRAQEKPPGERTREDDLALDGLFIPFGVDSFNRFEWENLAIEDDIGAYFPPSPLREPFHSLFTLAPEEGLRLLAGLCNHAMTAWQQLYKLASEEATPAPIEIQFPWGKQLFWGNNREYLWCRGMWAPKPIASALLSLEEWAFSEVERGREIDELIRQMLAGNECIAALGAAAAIAIESEAMTEGIFSLVTSQRLLSADHDRWQHDLTDKMSGLIGFTNPGDWPHIEAVKRINDRQFRQRELNSVISRFFLLGGDEFSTRIKAAISALAKKPAFEFEEQRQDSEAAKDLTCQAEELAELIEIQNYQRVETNDPEKVGVVHVSPSRLTPERIAQAGEAYTKLRINSLWVWGSKYFESGALAESFSLQDAVDFARDVDTPEIFDATENEAGDIDMHRGAVAVVAAVALNCPNALTKADLAWARRTVNRAFTAPEVRSIFWSVRSVIPWHHLIFVARGLAADIDNGTAEPDSPRKLLTIVAHPLEVVSLAALEAALGLHARDQKIGWSALYLALSLCVLPPRSEPRDISEGIHSPDRVHSAVEEAIGFYEEPGDWIALPLPAPAWIRVQGRDKAHETKDRSEGSLKPSGLPEITEERWAASPTRWYDHYAAEVIKQIPVKRYLSGPGGSKLLDFLAGGLEWTISKLSPPSQKGRREDSGDKLYEWKNELGRIIGKAAGLCPLLEVKARFLDPIFALNGDKCWELLAPLVDLYIRMYFYDAEEVPPDGVELLMQCLDRSLEAPSFLPGDYRSGDFHGFHLPRLVKSLMFVSVERIAPGAARYANGDWKEIDRILPVVDRYIRAVGWVSTIMYHFLTLCERSKEVYPAALFADQVLHVMDGGGPSLVGWHNSVLPARIASLVQYLSDRETPMPLALGQQFLRILDLLVDMGDRRSAALQCSETFRQIQIEA